jgi:hypothetical protein
MWLILTAYKKKYHHSEEFEDTNLGVIRICKSKKDGQHNGQKKKDKQESTKHYT